jgi:hypothetical protein
MMTRVSNSSNGGGISPELRSTIVKGMSFRFRNSSIVPGPSEDIFLMIKTEKILSSFSFFWFSL